MCFIVRGSTHWLCQHLCALFTFTCTRLLYVVCPILDLVTCIVITNQCIYNLILFVVVFVIDMLGKRNFGNIIL